MGAKVNNEKMENKPNNNFLNIEGSPNSPLYGINHTVRISDITIDDLEPYKGKNNWYDGNAMAVDWRRNRTRKEIYPFLKRTSVKDYISAIEALIDKPPYEFDTAQIRKRDGGKSQIVCWMHPLLFIRLTEYLDIFMSIKIMAIFAEAGIIHNDIKNSGEDRYSKYKDAVNKNKTISTYIAINKDNNTFKIGKSTDIYDREFALAAANPAIKMIASIDKDIERELHDKYNDKRISREWFNITNEDIKDIVIEYNFKQIGPLLPLIMGRLPRQHIKSTST